MNTLIETIEDRLFSAADSVCLERARLVTEAYAKHANEPTVITRALAFEHVLRNMSLDLRSNPVFAGNTSSAPRAWMLVPEFGLSRDAQVEIEHAELTDFLDGKVPDDIRAFWKERQAGGCAGIGHMSLDFDLVVNQGLDAVLCQIEATQGAGSEENRVYREAMAITCRAVIAWARRYAEQAEQMAAQCNDARVGRCLRRLADGCRHVPAKAARNLFEGLQAIALVHLAGILEGQGMSMSIGLPDRALSRFSPEVKENPEEAITLVRAFLLKIAANSFQGRGSKTQAVTIGGADPGGDVCNAVTRAFLDAFDRTPVNDPHLFLRWHKDIDACCWQKGIAMLARGRTMPLLVNDHQVVPGLLEAGVAPEDAWDYCIVGCNELGIPGRCCQSGFDLGMGFNDLEVIDEVVRSLDPTGITTERILDAYEESVRERASKGLARRRAHVGKLIDTRPFPFCSACCQPCVESGQDVLRGLPYSDIYGLFIRGTSNAVNALAAIEYLVVAQCEFGLPEMLTGVDARNPEVLAAIARVPKWGNDEDHVDSIGAELNRRRDRALRLAAREAGVPPFAVCHVVRSLHHLDGKRIGNTLDGRPEGLPVGDSIGGVLGTQTEGPTALLNSVLKLEAARWFTGIYNLNLTLPAGPQADVEVIRSLAEAFFHDGGQELQVSVLDAAELRRAQQDPDRYRDLVVRVAGLNARFVELSAVEQEELIRRAEAASGPMTGA